MSTTKQTIFLSLSVLLAYIWLTTPLLKIYSLQAFAAVSLGYFIIKKLTNLQSWQFLPKNYSLEIIFITFAVLLLVGSTGNLNSIFFPLVYVHLFILTITCKEKTTIIITMMMLLFHYSLSSIIGSKEITSIISIPVMLLFFLFVKKQYNDVQLSHLIIKKEEKEIQNILEQEDNLESFIDTFLKPKMSVLEEIISDESTVTDINEIRTQISLVSSESEKILERIRKTM